MKIKISFKQLEHTPALDERIQDKSKKLEKYFQGNINVQWVCWVHENQHWASIQVNGPKFNFSAKAFADNMYKSLDLVIEKIERQVEKQKTMKRNRIHTKRFESPKYKEIEEIIKDEEAAAQEWEEKSA